MNYQGPGYYRIDIPGAPNHGALVHVANTEDFFRQRSLVYVCALNGETA